MPQAAIPCRLRPFPWTCLLILWALVAGQTFGHGAIHQQIAQVSTQIGNEPGNAALLLKRGRLHMEDKHWAEARADFEQALKVDSEQHSALYFLAQVHLATEHPKEALKAVDRFAEAVSPKRGALFRARMLKGDVLRALDRPDEAAAEYGQALVLADSPRPAHFLAHADALVDAERPLDAVTTLDVGLKQLGSLIALESRAIEILRQNGKLTEAAQRLERLANGPTGSMRWRVEQGDVYLELAEIDRAWQAYTSALEDWDKLPQGRRGVPAMVALKDRAEAGLKTVERKTAGQVTQNE